MWEVSGCCPYCDEGNAELIHSIVHVVLRVAFHRALDQLVQHLCIDELVVFAKDGGSFSAMRRCNIMLYVYVAYRVHNKVRNGASLSLRLIYHTLKYLALRCSQTHRAVA